MNTSITFHRPAMPRSLSVPLPSTPPRSILNRSLTAECKGQNTQPVAAEERVRKRDRLKGWGKLFAKKLGFGKRVRGRLYGGLQRQQEVHGR